MNILMISSSLDSFLKLISVLLVFVFVLAITYVVTRWMAGYQKTQMKCKNLQIIETIPMGNNKMVCLLKAGTQYMVVSVGKDEIHPLMTLTEDQLADFSYMNDTQPLAMGESFQDILGQLKEKMSTKNNEK